MLINLLIFISVLSVFWAGGYIFGGGARRKHTLARIERMKQRKNSIPKTMQEMSLRRKNNEAKGLIQWLTRPLPNFAKLGDRLERAGLHISAKQYMLRRLLVMLIIMFLVSGPLHKPLTFGLSLGIIFGVWLPLKWLQRKVSKENQAFLRLFPDALDLIVRGLRSGLPVSESLVLVAQEVPDPVGAIFTNLSNTMKLGVSMEKALQETSRKLDLTEFNFFTTSIVLQRETGGNLSEILNNLSEVLRSRFLMKLKIKALSSEARASSLIVGILPFFVILAVAVIQPQYFTPLYTDPRGIKNAWIAAGMWMFGFWSMNRMAKFEI